MIADVFSAASHLRWATGGPDELVRLLENVNDATTRLIAADRLDDELRPLEAAMLRHPKHPLVTIGGGVFYAPGLPGFTHLPRRISVHYAPLPDGHSLTPRRYPLLALTAGGKTTAYRPHFNTKSHRQRLLRTSMKAIDLLQMRSNHEHLALTPAQHQAIQATFEDGREGSGRHQFLGLNDGTGTFHAHGDVEPFFIGRSYAPYPHWDRGVCSSKQWYNVAAVKHEMGRFGWVLGDFTSLTSVTPIRVWLAPTNRHYAHYAACYNLRQRDNPYSLEGV